VGIAQKFWPEKLKDKAVPTMTGVFMAMLQVLRTTEHAVFFSPVYLHVDPTDMIADTCPHEVAHIVAWKVFHEHGQGRWKQVMQKFGRNPVESQIHKLGTSAGSTAEVHGRIREARRSTS
jgi:hypothetical protein